MAKTAQYPPWRRAALQAIMWAIFASSLGAAAIVSAHLRKSGVSLDRSAECGRFIVRVPADWRTSISGKTEVIVTSAEMHRADDSQKAPRRLTFVAATVAPDALAEQVIEGDAGLGIGQGGLEDAASVTTASLVGSDADIFVRSSLRSIAILRMIPTTEYLAAVIEPDGSSIAVKMSCDGSPEASDLTFFRMVLGRVERAQP